MRINIYTGKKCALNFAIHSFLIAVSAACIFPLLWMLGTALKTQQTVFSDISLFPSHPHWENFYIAWTKGNFGIYFLNSIFYTAIVVIGIVIIASLAAYAFSRLEFKGKTLLFYMFLAAMMIPLPGSFVALFVALKKMHLTEGVILPRIGYIFALINVGLSLSIYLLKTFFDQMPKDLEDAARVDGCSKLGIWWHMALPIARPAIAVVVIFNALNVWNEYILAMLILQEKSMMPLQRGLMVFEGAHMTQYPLLMSGITITVIPITLIYLFMQKHIIKGITADTVKGRGNKWCLLAPLILVACVTAGCAKRPTGDVRKFDKAYYKDRSKTAPGFSEGVGPTVEKAATQEIRDLGRREAKDYDFGDDTSTTLTQKSWEALNHKDEKGALLFTERCIQLYKDEAKKQNNSLSDYPDTANIKNYQSLNDVGACYFIRGEFFKYKKDWQKAKQAYQTLIDEYSFAQYWDPRGWYWRPAEIAKDEIRKIDEGYYK